MMPAVLRSVAFGSVAALGALALQSQGTAPSRSSEALPRTCIYYVACSLDGRIAGRGDDLAWLGGRPEASAHTNEIDFDAFYSKVAFTVSGGRTHRWVQESGVENPYPTSTNYVVTRGSLEGGGGGSGMQLTNEDPVALVRRLKETAGPAGAVWVVGGGQLAASLFEAGVIDEVEVFVHPVILGDGAPLVSSALSRGVNLAVVEGPEGMAGGVTRIKFRVETRTGTQPAAA